MIIIFILLFLAVIFEVQVVTVALFVALVMALYFRYQVSKLVIPVIVTGLFLDALTPRNLGSTSLCLLFFITVVELVVLQRGAKREQYAWIGILPVILEGIIVGRGVGATLLGVLVYLGLSLFMRVTHGREGGFIVRREI